MSAATWKPAHASACDQLCYSACGDVKMATVALVDRDTLHCFMSETLVAKFGLLVLPGGGMEVTLTDGSQVKALKTYLVPLVVCSAH